MASSAPPDDGTAISKGGNDSTAISKDSGKTAVPTGDSTAMASVAGSDTDVPSASDLSIGSEIAIPSDDSTPVANPYVTGDTGGETAAPSAISKAPVTGDTSSGSGTGTGTGISDFHRTISELEGKVRTKDLIIDRFMGKVKENLSEINALKQIIDKKDVLINVLNGKILNSDEIEQNLKGTVQVLQRMVRDMQAVIEVTDRELERAKENLDRKDAIICLLNAALTSSGGLEDGIKTKYLETELLIHKLECMEDELAEFEGMAKVLEAKNLVLEVLESRLQHLEHECDVGSDDIVRQFKELLVIGEMGVKETRRMDAKFDDLKLALAFSEGEIEDLLLKIDRLEVIEENLNLKIVGLQDQNVLLKEEMWGNSLEYAVAITCYAEAYKELKAWLKDKCKEIEEFFKKQQDIIDS